MPAVIVAIVSAPLVVVDPVKPAPIVIVPVAVSHRRTTIPEPPLPLLAPDAILEPPLPAPVFADAELVLVPPPLVPPPEPPEPPVPPLEPSPPPPPPARVTDDAVIELATPLPPLPPTEGVAAADAPAAPAPPPPPPVDVTPEPL